MLQKCELQNDQFVSNLYVDLGNFGMLLFCSSVLYCFQFRHMFLLEG